MESRFQSHRHASLVVTAVLATATALLPISAAASENQCGKHKDVTRLLLQKYNESPVGLGITSQGGLVEVLTASDGATWSIIVTTPDGLSCLVAAGESWRSKTITPGPAA
jgi:hypothetical protein